MKIKNILYLFLLISFFLFNPASAEEDSPYALPLEDADSMNWVWVSVTSRIEDEKGLEVDEKVKLAFPNTPEEVNFFIRFFQTSDEEGMFFSFTILPYDGVTIWEGMNALAQSLLDQGYELFYMYPEEGEKNLSQCGIGYRNSEGEFSRVTFIKGTHFIYVLQTQVKDALYLKLGNLAQDSPEFEKLMHAITKTRIFMSSFSILD